MKGTEEEAISRTFGNLYYLFWECGSGNAHLCVPALFGGISLAWSLLITLGKLVNEL